MGKKVWLVAALVLLVGLIWVPAASAAPAAPPAPPVGGGFWHTVQYGESLSTIGWRYGVNPYTICTANGLYNCSFIYAGQQLWIPASYQPPVGPGGCCCRAYHTVTYGQTLSSIAAWYGTSAWQIADCNGIYNMNLIYSGQRLCIPGC